MAAATSVDPIPQPRDRTEFEIALICALKVEFDAAEALFDQYWDDNFYGKAENDPNAYTTGRIGKHNVVLAFMPGMGKTHSSSLAASLHASFTGIKLGLVVGICGGVPVNPEDEEILLGDVILSTGLVQHDFGYQLSDGMVRKDTLSDNLGRPNLEVRSLLRKLTGHRSKTQLETNVSTFLADLYQKDGFERSRYPGIEKDKLYKSTYRHKHHDVGECKLCERCLEPTDSPCDDALELSCFHLGCEDTQLVPRARLRECEVSLPNISTLANTQSGEREGPRPVVHFGLIASGDQVMKSAQHRDKISRKENVLAFEMEGAGVWDTFPTIVIKGVSDYADSHKNKLWQRYAAATAAACMKAFLIEWKGTVNHTSQRVQDSMQESQLSTLMAQLVTNQQKKPGELEQEFVWAIQKGDLETVKKQINEGQHVSFKTDVGTPLGLAIASKNQAIVQCLLEANADIEMQDNNMLTPLQVAFNAGSGEMMLMLLRHGAKMAGTLVRPHELVIKAVLLKDDELLKEALKRQPNLRLSNHHGQFAVHVAAITGNVAALKILLDAGGDPSMMNLNRETPLLYAMRATTIDNHVIAEELLKRSPSSLTTPNHTKNTPLGTACRNQPAASVTVLLNHGAAAKPNREAHLENAIRIGRAETVKAFLDFGVDVNSIANSSKKRPIQIVAETGSTDIAELLVSYGAEWQHTGLNLLATSIMHCQIDFVNWLVSRGIDINASDVKDPQKPRPPMCALVGIKASLIQQSSMIRFLLEHGADIDCHTPFADTVLCEAAASGDIELMKQLVANKASLKALKTALPHPELNNVVAPGLTPLHYATHQNKLSVIEFLLSSGADADAQDYYGFTAVHKVAFSSHNDGSKLSKIQKLHSLGASLDLRNTRTRSIVEITNGVRKVKRIVQGSTSAHMAARNDDALQTLEYIVANSSTVNSQDGDGNTPLHIAVEGCNPPKSDLRAVQSLLRSGADVRLRNVNGETAFYIAVRKADFAAMVALLNAGSDIQGATANPAPLVLSAKSTDARIAEMLLKKGTAVNSDSGRLAFEFACKAKNTSVVSLLLDYGLPLEDRRTKLFALHCAAKVDKNTDMISLLLKRGAAINGISDTGRTALHEVAASGAWHNVTILTGAKADKGIKDNDGRTPADLRDLWNKTKAYVEGSTSRKRHWF